MLWKFSIRNDGTPAYAQLTYDWDKDIYSMEIFENCKDYLDVCPLLIMIWYQRGERLIDDKRCRGFISCRVIPCGRHNMGTILCNLNLKFYHECFMLRYYPKCVMDDARVDFDEEIKTREDDISFL